MRRAPPTLYPAIDIKDGCAVRLSKGDMKSAVIFNKDPRDQALIFKEFGCEWLHLVDLNGAIAGGASPNRAIVRDIVAQGGSKVQLGGGIRSLKDIETWLNLGVIRVILGTLAVKDPKIARQACRAFPGQIVLGIDARGDRVAVEGWSEASNTTTLRLVETFAQEEGLAAIVYTDIERDGMMKGLNFEATRALAEAASVPVIASGGMESLRDIALLMAPENHAIEGAIIGRAYYERKIDIREARAYVWA